VSPSVLVVCALDPPSDLALREADERARAQGARLVVCRVLPRLLPVDPALTHLSGALTPARDEQRGRLAAELRAHVSERLSRSPDQFDVHVDEGVAYATTVTLAEQAGARLIVVGAEEPPSLDRVLHGRLAIRVVRAAHCSVLVTRARRGRGPIVVGTDFSDPSQLAVATAAAEARRIGARLTLVHAIDLAPTVSERAGMAFGAPGYVIPESVRRTLWQAVEARLAAMLDRFEVPGRTRVLEGSAARSLVDVVTDEEARLLVVGTLGRTGIQRLAVGSIAEAVALEAPCPVLVVRSGPDRNTATT
jgi:nucleotide-binding universal stress UspA family protein